MAGRKVRTRRSCFAVISLEWMLCFSVAVPAFRTSYPPGDFTRLKHSNRKQEAPPPKVNGRLATNLIENLIQSLKGAGKSAAVNVKDEPSAYDQAHGRHAFISTGHIKRPSVSADVEINAVSDM